MLKTIEGLPANVLALQATGKVTHEDYRDVLIPKAEAMMSGGPIRMLFVIADDATGFELEALWDDAAFGISHWRNFSSIAVVSDHLWVRAMITVFTPFIQSEVRLFGLSDLSHAKAWIMAV